ncbi:MAG: undecaprenyl-diphosphate phosphatase [Eubacteriales bacterium]|jgi:undecaprenyl-diphosphatase|nr:undecaprenyl-diphosphate phosphatase [Eubacteriales bacterium]
MTNLNAIILGLIQGLAEFLPISSSGHLVIFQKLLGLPNSEEYIVFDILLHVGTLVSVFFFYWKDVLGLIRSFFGIIGNLFKGRVDFKSGKRNLLVLLFVATLPLVVVFLFKDKIDRVFSSSTFVGAALLVTGVILWLTDKIRQGGLTDESASYKNALMVGIFQLFAILPGISRSGSTIFGGMLSGMKKEFAVKFSLLLSIIAVLGAAVSSVPDMVSGAGVSATATQCILGMAVSAISGIFAIKFLVKMLSKGNFKVFAFYCWAVGIITIIMSLG